MLRFPRATLRPRRVRRRAAPAPLVLVCNDPNPDAHLLRVLTRTVGPDLFDAISISANAYYGYPQLREALRFLDVRWDRCHYLQPRSLNRVRRWLDNVAGRDIDGLRLMKNEYGYCTIEIVAPPERIVGFDR